MFSYYDLFDKTVLLNNKDTKIVDNVMSLVPERGDKTICFVIEELRHRIKFFVSVRERLLEDKSKEARFNRYERDIIDKFLYLLASEVPSLDLAKKIDGLIKDLESIVDKIKEQV